MPCYLVYTPTGDILVSEPTVIIKILLVVSQGFETIARLTTFRPTGSLLFIENGFNIYEYL